jgi:hypothetical protein
MLCDQEDKIVKYNIPNFWPEGRFTLDIGDQYRAVISSNIDKSKLVSNR